MMPDNSAVFVSAFTLGVLFCAPPGPVFAETVHRGLRGGFLPACSVQLGSVVGDACWALVGLSGGAALLQWSGLQVPLALTGVALLTWLGVGSLREARTMPPPPAGNATARTTAVRSSLLAGAGLALSNPWNVVYWTAMAGALPVATQGRFSWSVQGLFLAGFLLACVLWAVACAGLIAVTRRRLPPRAWQALHAVCGLGLLAYAAVLLWRVAGG